MPYQIGNFHSLEHHYRYKGISLSNSEGNSLCSDEVCKTLLFPCFQKGQVLLKCMVWLASLWKLYQLLLLNPIISILLLLLRNLAHRSFPDCCHSVWSRKQRGGQSYLCRGRKCTNHYSSYRSCCLRLLCFHMRTRWLIGRFRRKQELKREWWWRKHLKVMEMSFVRLVTWIWKAWGRRRRRAIYHWNRSWTFFELCQVRKGIPLYRGFS